MWIIEYVETPPFTCFFLVVSSLTSGSMHLSIWLRHVLNFVTFAFSRVGLRSFSLRPFAKLVSLQTSIFHISSFTLTENFQHNDDYFPLPWFKSRYVSTKLILICTGITLPCVLASMTHFIMKYDALKILMWAGQTHYYLSYYM